MMRPLPRAKVPVKDGMSQNVSIFTLVDCIL